MFRSSSCLWDQYWTVCLSLSQSHLSFLCPLNILCDPALTCVVLFSPLFLTLCHLLSPCLPPPLINTSACFFFSPSSHFWSHCRKCTNTRLQVEPNNTFVVFAAMWWEDFTHKEDKCTNREQLIQYTRHCSYSSFLSIPMTTRVREIARGWEEDGGKIERKKYITTYCMCSW